MSSSSAFTSATFLQRPYPGAGGAGAAGAGGAEDDGVGERMYAWEGALDMSWVRLRFLGGGIVGLGWVGSR